MNGTSPCVRTPAESGYWAVIQDSAIRFTVFAVASSLLILPAISADSFPPPVSIEVRQEIEGLLRDLPTAERGTEGQLMDRLLSRSQNFALYQTALDLGKSPEGKRILGQLIPWLISRLDGPQVNQAYVILISIQGECPAPKREVWEEWWRREGHRYDDDATKAASREATSPK